MKTFLQKMRLSAGKACFLNVPPALHEACSTVPSAVTASRELLQQPDFVLAFFIRKKDLELHLSALQKEMAPETKIWLAYPKAKQLETDLNRDIIAELVTSYGLEGVAIVSIDEIWSALRVVKQ